MSLPPRSGSRSVWSSRQGGPFVAASLALVLSSAAVRADIYRTESPDGIVSFTNRPLGKKSRLVAKSARRANPVMPKDASPERVHRYDAVIYQAAALYQIPVALVRAVMKVESDFDPRVVSPANAHGLMQLIPETAERMMVKDLHDPRQNIFGGVRYLRVLANLFNGDLELTIAAYNAGENAVIRHRGIPPFEETQRYVTKVLSYYRYYRSHDDR